VSSEDVGLFLLRRLGGAAGSEDHSLEFKPDLPLDR
jgi:hypothetical protein